MRLHRQSSGGIILVAAGLWSGCQSTGASPVGTSQPDPACLVNTSEPRPTVSIGVDQSVSSSNAPVPRIPAERLLFRQLYETLVSVDCTGRTIPELAEWWAASEQGAVWQFRLRADARFSDGSALTARDVADSWSARLDSGLPIANLTVLTERELRVTLTAPITVDRFADPALAVARRAGDGWPLGTGPYHVEAVVDARVVRVTRHASAAALPRTIEFRTMETNDARRALDSGVDAVVTGDPTVLAYAQARRDYTVAALPWSRTYVLASRRPNPMAPPADALLALGREAVRVETRPPEPSFWWQRESCRPALLSVRTERSRTIVYPIGDPIARGIAERMVALAWPVTRAPDWLRAHLGVDYASLGSPVATGLDDRMLLESLRTGRALAVVAALPRTAGVACLTTGDAIAAALLSGWEVTPLLEARDYLIHRGGLGRLVVDGDGVIRFTAAAR